VIVGHEQLQRRISWARAFITRPWAIGPLEQDALVILSVRGLSSASEIQALPRLIDALIAAKVTAVVFSDELPEIIEATAGAEALPVLVLPADASLPDVERAIIGLIVDRDGQVQRRAVEVYQLLIQQAIEDAPTERMATSLAEAAGRVVYLEDEYGVLQAVAAPAEFEPLGLPSPEQATTLYSAHEVLGLTGSAPIGTAPPSCIRRVLSDHQYEVCSAPISLGNTVGGFLTLLGSASDIQDLDEQIVTRAASAFAFPIAKHRAIMETQTRLQGSFLESLFAGTMADEEEIAARAKYLGHNLSEPYDTVCLVLDDTPKGDGRAGRVDGDHAGRWTSFVDLARRELIDRWPRALLRERGDLLAVLLPARESPPVPTVRESLEDARVRLARMLESAATVGLGRRAAGAGGILESYREAEQAARIGNQFLGGNRTIAFEELGVYRLIARVDDPDALDGFRREYLGPLEEYDARHAAELIDTLEGFFTCNGNHAKAAELLHLHRNTLLYRLERIEALTGRDLADAETRLSLQLALKIRRVFPTIRASQPKGHRGGRQ
jgi:PucR family transcriptional regulator, purine catabolism regulatory protein